MNEVGEYENEHFYLFAIDRKISIISTSDSLDILFSMDYPVQHIVQNYNLIQHVLTFFASY